MRVFKRSDDVAEKIAKEMFNIETGMLYYEPDKPVNEKPTLYPCIEQDSIKTTIRSVVGFIYLPADLMAVDAIMYNVEEHLNALDKIHNHLVKHARLERPGGHFTAMKVKNKNTLNKNLTDGYTNDNGWKRSYIFNPPQLVIGKTMHNSRFYWFIFPISVMIKNIEQFATPRFSPTTQFVSIVYDIHDHISVADGTKLETNITFQNFRVCKNLVSFNPLQSITADEIAKPKEEVEDDMTDEEKQAFIDAKKCPRCRKAFKAKGGLTRHMNQEKCDKYVAPPPPVLNGTPPPLGAPVTTIAGQPTTTPETTYKPCAHCKRNFKTIGSLKTHLKKCKMATSATASLAKAELQKDNMDKFLKMTPEEKKLHLEKMGGHPEYMPQWNDVAYDADHGLALCPKRGIVFELIRYYGNWDLYKEDFGQGIIPIQAIPMPIYEESFHNVIIDQSLAPGYTGKPANAQQRQKKYPMTVGYSDAELCSCCYTPLCEDIYMVMSGIRIEGYAVCGVCMHYDPSIHCGTGKTILRVSYPTTIRVIIEKTGFSPLKKNIMKQWRPNIQNFVDSVNSYKAFYIGYDPKEFVNKTLDEKRPYEYIGWTGFLSDFISYMSGSNNYYQSHSNEAMLTKWAEGAKIFPAKVIGN